ncbi:hypothetical protein PBI_CLUBL_89 [Gordonia phage ClubL]|uniref:Uncharacterized protein n=1 Tax=Gordonia phage ClubL TaxID=1838065 RepID=A0A166YA92_9CAUD|nr:hypothetical protein BH768_gp118 [Gordonia phage ClubL]ANA86587.1 hypothetical protein PBI_CLUBL_89 [Gordonia phage ClubL]
MTRKSMQADIDTLYAWLDQQSASIGTAIEAVGEINKVLSNPPAIGVHEFIAPWQIKMELLNIYKGDVDAARSAFDWLKEGAEKVTVATEGEQA